MPEITTRVKRPVQVRTLEWTGENTAEMLAFTGAGNFLVGGTGTGKVYDKLHHTWVSTYPGQHVVEGVRGELYPIAADVLEQTYQDPPEHEIDATNVPAPGDNTVTIGQDELFTLRQEAGKLRALEAAGVDNWSGYEHAMEIWREERGD